MKIQLIGAFVRNAPFGTEIAFAKGLRRLGHDVHTCDTSYPESERLCQDADATVVFKWMENDYWDAFDKLREPKIVYQPDDLRFEHIRQMMDKMKLHCEYALTFDDTGAEIARSIGFKESRSLMVTADDELYRPRSFPKKRDIDVTFVGSLSGGPNHVSRARMVQLADMWAQKHNLKTCFISGLNDPYEINSIYNRSKIVINHATDVGQGFGWGYGLQCRHFEVGMAGAFLLSNALCESNETYEFAEFSNESDFVDALDFWHKENELRERYLLLYHNEIMRSHRPEHRAAELISFIEGVL